ncbi:MAG: DUF3313 domain-containing protein [Azoarcus sp.]|nr:DUF3313 domain-containing protein [Azoarcus sp.]
MLIKRTLVLAGALFMLAPQAFAADSGFIDNLPALAKDADRPGAMIWTKPGLDRSAYTKVMMEPVQIFISPNSEYKGVDANEMKALADSFHEIVTNTLEPEIPVLSKGGPGVIYIRAALTNVKLSERKRGLLSYTPVGLVVNVAIDAAGGRVSLNDAALEIEMLDSVTGERLGVLIDKAPKAPDSDKLSWDTIRSNFTFYAERFKERMLATK